MVHCDKDDKGEKAYSSRRRAIAFYEANNPKAKIHIYRVKTQ